MPLSTPSEFRSEQPVLGVIGAGNYASRVLIPALKAAGAQFHTIVTSGGISGAIHGVGAGFAEASTDEVRLLENTTINSVVIATRHDTHASFVTKALRAGKHVFVEKPLAIDRAGLDAVIDAYAQAVNDHTGLQLMVGFNRRFAPQVVKIKDLLSPIRESKSFLMTINAGAIPPEHWTQDIAIGGGRIIGEACHFIDLMRFLAGCKISSVQASRMGDASSMVVKEDKASITLGFEDGSFGTILYLANGHSSFPKERIEVFAANRVLQLDNFRKLKGFGWPGFKKMNLWRQDKGQSACAAAFLRSVQEGEAAIPVEELFEVSDVTIRAAQILREQ